MKIREVMTSNPCFAWPDDSVKEAAKKMKEHNCGILPIEEKGCVTGILTDRDIVVRAIAGGKSAEKTIIRDIMTKEVIYCYEDDSLLDAADKMALYDVSRLIVMNKNEKMTGIVSLADIIKNTGDSQESHSVIQRLLKTITA